MVIGGRGAARVQPFVERHQPYIKPSIPADAYSTVMTRTNASVDATIEVLLMGLDPRAQSKRLIDELTALHQRKVLKVVDMVIVRREADRSISASARTELSDTEAKHLRRAMKSAVGFQLGPEQQVSTVRFEGTSVLLGGRAAEQRQHHLGDQRLNPEQQERADKERGGVKRDARKADPQQRDETDGGLHADPGGPERRAGRNQHVVRLCVDQPVPYQHLSSRDEEDPRRPPAHPIGSRCGPRPEDRRDNRSPR